MFWFPTKVSDRLALTTVESTVDLLVCSAVISFSGGASIDEGVNNWGEDTKGIEAGLGGLQVKCGSGIAAWVLYHF